MSLSHSANYCSFGASLKSGSERPSTLFLLKSSLSLASPFLILCFSPLNSCMNFRVDLSILHKRIWLFTLVRISLTLQLCPKGIWSSHHQVFQPLKEVCLRDFFYFFPAFETLNMLIIIIISDMGKCECVCFDVHVEVNFIKLVLSLNLSCILWEWHVGLQACLTSTYTHWVISTSQAFKASYLHI